MMCNYAVELLKANEVLLENWGNLNGFCGMSNAEVKLEQVRQAVADLEEKDMQRQMRREAE